MSINDNDDNYYANKFARNWLKSKPKAITGYAEVADTLAQSAINNQDKLLSKFQESVNSGKWANKLRPYINNDRMAKAYEEKVNLVTNFSETSLNAFEYNTRLQRNFAKKCGFIDTLITFNFCGRIRALDSIPELQKYPLYMVGMQIHNKEFTPESTGFFMCNRIAETLISKFGFPHV